MVCPLSTTSDETFVSVSNTTKMLLTVIDNKRILGEFLFNNYIFD